MMDQQKDYSHLTEDQSLHNRFTAYIIVAFRNQKINHWKKMLRDAKKLVPLDEVPEKDPALSVPFENMDHIIDKDSSLETVISNKTLLACIANLSDRDRRIINLRIIHNMKHSDIAKLMGLKNKTVEKAYERLLKKMRTRLGGSRNARF